MIRDIRDPLEIGAALEAQRAHSPTMPIGKLADQILEGDTVRHYGESNEAFANRTAESQGYARNYQLAMFREA